MVESKVDQTSSEDTTSSNSSASVKEIRMINDKVMIDERTLPFIFRFNYPALKRMKLVEGESMPKVGKLIFKSITERQLANAKGRRFSNRMKDEEKIKFLVRVFEQREAKEKGKEMNRTTIFRKEGVKAFFQRLEVRNHFLTEVYQGLIKKKVEN